MQLFLMLVFCHCLADYPLQNDFLAKAKTHERRFVNSQNRYLYESPIGRDWWIALCAHSIIQAGFVAIVTNSVWLGVAEFVAHALIDYSKCDGKTSLVVDQALHLLCKAGWVCIVVASGAV